MYRPMRFGQPIPIHAFLFACLVLLPTNAVRAQYCASPATLTPNTPTWFNTCHGGNDIVLACGAELLGPSTVVRMPLPYPLGRVTVQSLTPGYEPVMYLLRAECLNTAMCAHIADGVMALSEVDSGDYFLVVSTPWWDSQPCGLVAITHELTPQEQMLATNGVFRSGITAVPEWP